MIINFMSSVAEHNIYTILFLKKAMEDVPREYHNTPVVASQRKFVIGGVAGGSLACTFTLGFFFVCFNKREQRHPNPDCSSTTSISPDSC
jgi:hypothetical protein